MAIPTNAQTTFTTIGNREDLSDVIYDISPMETPFSSNVSREGASGVFTEWQTEVLDAAAANIQIEGDDATANTVVPATRVGNYQQISRRVPTVSKTQREVNRAGVGDEYTHQTLRNGNILKRDMEYALTRNQASSAGGEGTGRALGSLESWLSTNKTSVGTGTAQTTAGFAAGVVAAPVDSTVLGALTKDAIDDVIQKCWTQGGNPTTIMVGPHNRTVISGFSGISTLQTDANSNQDITLIGGVDFYKSNFGILKVVPNRFQRDETAFVLDMDMLGIASLRDMSVTPLSKTGDSDKALIVSEYTLKVKNEAASGKVTDCTTS